MGRQNTGGPTPYVNGAFSGLYIEIYTQRNHKEIPFRGSAVSTILVVVRGTYPGVRPLHRSIVFTTVLKYSLNCATVHDCEIGEKRSRPPLSCLTNPPGVLWGLVGAASAQRPHDAYWPW